jgi:hypothetical protein
VSEQLLGLQSPIVPPMMVDVNYPPYVPNVAVHPEVAYLKNTVAALVINESVEKIILNHSRLFLFNLICYNSYQNETFHEIVELVLGHIYINTQRGRYRSYDMAVNDSVSFVMTTYASHLFFRYPNLKSMVAPQIVNAAYQNLQSFNNLKEEVRAMFNNGGYPTNMPHGSFSPGHVPVQHMQHPQYMHNPNMHNNGRYERPNSTYVANSGANTMFGNMVSQSAFINRGSSPESTMRDARFKTMSDSNERNQTMTTPSVAVTESQETKPQQKAEVNKDKTVILEMEGGSERNFSNSSVTFLDVSVDLNNFERSAHQYRSIERLGNEKADEGSENNKYLQSSVNLETNLENAIITARVKQFEMQRSEMKNNVFRCFSVITNPFFSSYDLSQYYKVLQSCDNFEGLVGKLRSIAMAVSRQEDKSYVAAVVTFLNVVDEILTELVNDFLRNKLDMRISIDSFTADSIDLKPYLFKKDVRYCEAYEAFENDVMNVVFEELDEELMKMSAEELGVPEGLNHYVLPVNHTLTLTFLNDKELGMKIKDGLNVIDATNCNSLYNLAASLFRHKKEAAITTLVDYLVTVDNRRYKLYKDCCKPDTYYIRKV